MIYVLWVLLVIGSVFNTTSLTNFSYESIALVVVCCLGCFRELLLSYVIENLKGNLHE